MQLIKRRQFVAQNGVRLNIHIEPFKFIQQDYVLLIQQHVVLLQGRKSTWGVEAVRISLHNYRAQYTVSTVHKTSTKFPREFQQVTT